VRAEQGVKAGFRPSAPYLEHRFPVKYSCSQQLRSAGLSETRNWGLGETPATKVSPLEIQGQNALSRKLAAVNPFYVVLVLAGAVFCVTACAYGVMAFRDVRGGEAVAEADSRGLMGFLDRHGAALMAAEVVVLGMATVAAIWTDPFWTRRAARGVGLRPADNSQQDSQAGEPPTLRRDQP
jgi:hypothetical protein